VSTTYEPARELALLLKGFPGAWRAFIAFDDQGIIVVGFPVAAAGHGQLPESRLGNVAKIHHPLNDVQRLVVRRCI
jgi:hypothetical protein